MNKNNLKGLKLFLNHHTKLIISFILFAACLFAYISTLSPTVNFGDSGELIIAAKTLGIPHSPGFPSWVLLSHLFTYIPYGEMAWRVNLSSAVYTAITIVFVYLTILYVIEKLNKDAGKINNIFAQVVSVSISLTLAFTGFVWSQAIITEVYSLSMLFVSILIYLSLKYYFDKQFKTYILIVFLMGFGLGSHYITAIIYPFVVSLLIISVFANTSNHKKFWDIHRFNYKKILKYTVYTLISFLMGLSIFLYLPLRSLQNPPIDWGNPENLENFIKVVTREQFSTVTNLSVNSQNTATNANIIRILSNLYEYIILSPEILISIFTPPLFLLGIYGLYILFKSDKKLFTAFLIGLFFSLTFFAWYTNFKIDDIFYDFSFPGGAILFSMLISMGLYGTLIALQIKSLVKPVAIYFAAGLILLIPLDNLIKNYENYDLSDYRIAYNHAKLMLDLVEDDAVLFVEENDWLFPVSYLHIIEKVKPNVTIYDRNGNMFEDIYGINSTSVEDIYEQDRKAIEEKIITETNRPAYYLVDKKFANYGYENIYPFGTFYKYATGAEDRLSFNETDFETYYSEILNIDIKNYKKYKQAHYMIAYYHLKFADLFINQGEFDKAKKQLEIAEKWAKDDQRMLNNIGYLYAVTGETEKAKETFGRAIVVKDNKVSHHNLGQLYQGEGDVEKAESEYLKAINIDPKYISALLSLFEIYKNKKSYPEALKIAKILAEIDPGNISYKVNREYLEGLINGKVTEETNSAIENEANGNDNNPVQPAIIPSERHSKFINALFLAKEGECMEAIPIFEELDMNFPNDVQIMNNLGVCYAQTGDLESAGDYWRAVVIIDPDNDVALENLKMLESIQ